MKTTLLFVDDDPMILDGFRAMLRSRRKAVRAWFAPGGREALELLEQESVDIVIADMRMPGMSGDEVLRQVAERSPNTVRIVLSGYSEMDAVLRSVKPAHQFLSKPCNTDVLFATIDRVSRLRHILTNPAIQRVVGGLGTLPALPSVYMDVQAELMSPDPSLRKVGEIVQTDPGMAASVLKVVNSSFFGFFEKINSPVHAVTLLGVETLKALLLGIHFIQECRPEPLKGYSLDKLWTHSLQTACMAKIIAKAEESSDHVVDTSFMAGLLHDVGKLVLASEAPEAYQEVLDGVRAGAGVVRDVEMEVLGVSHAEVGAYLLGLWGMNPCVVEGVHAHHEPSRGGEGFTPSVAVHVGNRLQHEMVVVSQGYQFSPLDTEWLEGQGLADNLDVWREVCGVHLKRSEKDGTQGTIC